MSNPSDTPSRIEVTHLLRAWGEGDDAALNRLTILVETELHRLAHHYMSREKPGHTLQTTALVNELYLRLVNAQEVSWQDRAHFFAISARMMRRILTDFARTRSYQKRGGAAVQVSWDEELAVAPQKGFDVVALDDALKELSALDPRKSQVVEMRFFAGLSLEETAEALGISIETVKRDWRFAKTWLHRALGDQKAS
jgi:RNA polymerase sigma factor (TIGR02999 family)